MDLPIAIWRLSPTSEYALTDDKTDIREWRDKSRPQPSKAELQAAWDAYVAETAEQQAAQERATANVAAIRAKFKGQNVKTINTPALNELVMALAIRAGLADENGIIHSD